MISMFDSGDEIMITRLYVLQHLLIRTPHALASGIDRSKKIQA